MVVLGTRNHKKGIELAALLGPLGITVRDLSEFADVPEVEETGTTFAENAALKATGYARYVKHWVLADDSGLCVDALKGAPGVYSARYAGPSATDEDNNQRLLADLASVPTERRSSHYVCHVALADPAGNIRARAEDVCCGRMLTEYHGTGGFGYDPLFELPEYHRTFGELAPEVKKCLSHRARAMRKIAFELLVCLSS
ncbi:MAG: RdgB/HAM1 family non-canonical purine NTP pyrophosphatase [Planctomycetes bacterium]|nr:RdgB/HAM1 family non-canonical purine NTP pyrophosphatase [Planctomycetota bacterium]